MKKQLLLVAGILFLAFNSCGGGGGSDPVPSTVTVTISPSTDGQSMSVAVTAEFSGEITEPADQTAWLAAFKLQKDAAGDNLCTEITYANKIATCAHDDLVYSSSYTVTVSGLTDSEGNAIDEETATFGTEEDPTLSVNGISKTSVAAIGTGNTVMVTFNFSGAPEEAPMVTTNGSGAQECVLSDDSCSVTLANIEGCKTLQDYTLALTGTGINDYTYIMNSADDEFDKSATLVGGTCYTDRTVNCTATITSGVLRIEQPAEDADNCDIYKIFSQDFAVTLKTGSFSPGTSGNGARIQTLSLMEDGDPYGEVGLNYGLFESDTQWIWTGGNGGPDSIGIAKTGTEPEGSLAQYKCLVFANNKVYSYISDDGETFIHLTTANTEAALGTTLPNPLDYTADWTSVRTKIKQSNTSNIGELVGTFDFIRFRSGSLTGASADCPKLY